MTPQALRETASRLLNGKRCGCGRPSDHRGCCSARAVKLGHPDFRGAVLEALNSGGGHFELDEIVSITGISEATIRRHLKALAVSGKVTQHKDFSWSKKGKKAK